MARQTWIKLGGVWESLTNIYMKQVGSWLPKVMSWIKVNGVWKQCMYYALSRSDFFLPSKDEIYLMYTNLHLFGLGGFSSTPPTQIYWSSSEMDVYSAYTQNFATGSQSGGTKNFDLYSTRACRSFISPVVYNLREYGPSLGLIFSVTDNGDSTYTYLECAPSDQTYGVVFSNITDQLAGTNTAVGTGQANTTAIISQVGHTTSAAKSCDDLVI